jgi:hypothetical protein
MERLAMEEWMQKCQGFVRHAQVWDLIQEWDWAEAYATDFTPAHAVRCALLDVLAPRVGEEF